MASRYHRWRRYDRWTSSAPGVGRINHDGRSGYWHPPKRLGRRQKKRVRRPEPWWPCKAFSFSFFKHLRPRRSHQTPAYSGQLPANKQKRIFVIAITSRAQDGARLLLVDVRFSHVRHSSETINPAKCGALVGRFSLGTKPVVIEVVASRKYDGRRCGFRSLSCESPSNERRMLPTLAYI